MSYRQIKKVLRKNGWKCIRTYGSHYQFRNIETGITVPIPYHGSKDYCIGTLRSIEKLTGLSFR